MDSALSLSTTTLLTISKALNRRFIKAFPSAQPRLTPTRASFSNKPKALPFAPLSSSSSLRRTSCVRLALPQQIRRRLDCLSSSAASFGTAGGGGGGNVIGGGSGRDGGSDGGESMVKSCGGVGEEASALSPDVIILDVGGMMCGGCAASVKKILESQPQVSSASVNLTTESAIVWPVSEAKVIPNWQRQLGEALAKHLTNSGFASKFRVAGQEDIEEDLSS